MQKPVMAEHLAPARPPAQRYAGFAFVGLLHVALIWALINGLAVKIVKEIPHVMKADVIEVQPEQPREKLPDIKPAVETPRTDTIPEPDIKIDAATPPPPITAAPAQEAPTADTAASALGSTHTIPPYPPSARRLGHEGRVQLRLTISPQGQVVKAEVVTSSGWPELDQEAVNWVEAHWRYKPAIRGGVPVMATAMAAVKFDLKSAR